MIDRGYQIKQIVLNRWDGVLTTEEALARLDALRIRGAFKGSRLIAYDYENQHWLDVGV